GISNLPSSPKTSASASPISRPDPRVSTATSPSRSRSTMIEARGLVKRYGSTMAVNDLSFSVPPGMVTGFLGPNGAGKTTTMRMILGLDAPAQGSVTVGGRSYRDLPAPVREVGALLDARALHGGRRAFDHLLCLARGNGIARGRAEEVLGIAGKNRVITTTRGLHAFLPCFAAVVASDPELRGRNHPPPPDLDRLAVAEASPRAAGPPGPGLPAQRRDVRQPRGRVRGRHGHCLAVRGGDGRTARRTGAEAAQGGPGRGEGRARLRRPGRDADPHRPGRRGPALLLRQAQEARHEPAGHRRPPEATSSGSPERCPARSTTRRPSGCGASWPNWRPGWSPSPTRATRGARTRRSLTRGRTSRIPRNRPTRRTRSSAHPAKGRTPSSRPGRSSPNSAAA